MGVGNEQIAASLKTARLAKGLTQKELGRRVGMPQSHISKIESGGVDLQLSSLTELSRALDLEVKLVPRAAVVALESVLRTVGSPTSSPPVPAYRLSEGEA
ncbi:MAG: transcriptional regulator [Croceicoccus sp.]|nr:transcriptional regulator [Croceicoccus sp.]MAL26380.1 transcriptional regulator [Croceicoccus sp.]|tara:strand:+ start:1318 stop:1620 length:303 start_codon:yes stop_codon:yes gene_type:complete